MKRHGTVVAYWRCSPRSAAAPTRREVDLITEFLRASNELLRRHLERISPAS